MVCNKGGSRTGEEGFWKFVAILLERIEFISRGSEWYNKIIRFNEQG